MGVSRELEDLVILLTPKLSAEGKAAMKEVREEMQRLEGQAGSTERLMGTGLSDALEQVADAATDSSGGLAELDKTLADLEKSLEGAGAPAKGFADDLKFFAAGSAGLSAIIVGLGFLVEAYDQVQQGIAEAVEKAEEAQVRFTRATQREQQDRNPVRFAAEQLQAALAEQARLVEEIRKLEDPDGFRITWNKFGDLEKLNAQLTETRALVNLLGLEFAQAAKASNVAIRDEQFEDPKKMARDLQAQAEAVKAFKKQLEDLADNATTSQIDNLARAIARLEAEGARLGVSAAPGIAALKGQLEDLQTFEQFGGGFDEIRSFEELEEVNKRIRDLKAQGLTVARLENEANRTALRLQQQITREYQKQTDAALTTGAAGTQVDEWEQERLRLLRESVDEMENLARGAIGGAQGVGLITAETAGLLQNLTTVVGRFAELKGGLGGVGGIAAVIAAAGGALGAIGALFGGESPQARANREAIERNTALLARVAAGLESFGSGISSRERDIAARFLASYEQFATSNRREFFGEEFVFEEAARRAGISMAELERIARELGIELVKTKEGAESFEEALGLARGAAFGPGFGDRRAGADLLTSIEDNTSAQEKAQRYLQAIASVDNGRLRQLEQFDLSTEVGRQAAEAFLLATAELLNKGIPLDTGTLTGDEFRQILEEFDDLIDAAQEEGQVGGRTEQFGISQTITVAQASQILAYLGTANVWAQTTAENTAQIAAHTAAMRQMMANGYGAGAPAAAAQPTYLQDRALAAGNNVIA